MSAMLNNTINLSEKLGMNSS